VQEHGVGTGPRSWIGQPVKRNEDARFLTGRGQYVDDIVVAGMLHAAMVRSPYAHARVKSIAVSKALELPGVYGVITGADVVGVIEPEKGSTYPSGGTWHYMATDTARFAGEIVAVVAAEDRYIAEDAADLVEVEYEPLPIVTDPEHAADPDQPELHPGAPGGNEVLDKVWEFGDVDGVFAEADVVVSDRFEMYRHGSTPLEGLAAIASFDALTEQVTIWANLGNLGRYSASARALKLGHADVRLVVPDVGGHFGVKAWVHQRAVLLAVLSRKVGRPVKWTEDRLEHLQASHHGTGRIGYIELAGKRDGTILGMRMRLIDDQGAYVCLNEPFGAVQGVQDMTGPYAFQNARVESVCVLTNKCPVSSNRAYGRVQYFFVLERAIDRLARELDLDPAELRARNLIPAEAFPYRTPSGTLYDSGDPPALLDMTKRLLGYDDLRREQAEARQAGRLVGLGLCCAMEHTGPKAAGLPRQFGVKQAAPSAVDVATVSIDPEGRLTVQSPTLCQGQGHETTIAQIVADQFDVEPSKIRVVVRLDTSTMQWSPSSGTYGSRFSTTGAPAVHGAAKKLRAQLAAMAASFIEAHPDDIEFVDGSARVKGVPDRAVTLRELAATAHIAPRAFGMGTDLGLEATFHFGWPGDDPGSNTVALILHGALVEVDRETGLVKVLKYVATEDCGRIINPMIVDGQTMGGVINGLGWVFTERFIYDDDGQLLTGTFMDYILPRFTDIPPLQLGHIETPTPFSELGSKGMGESGTIPPPACIANAVEDAIWHLGGRITESHLSPEVVLRAIQTSRGG
jgi:2-furoyl-CoA dehydrogenase large subunit